MLAVVRGAIPFPGTELSIRRAGWGWSCFARRQADHHILHRTSVHRFVQEQE
jgi:hypothetical protein